MDKLLEVKNLYIDIKSSGNTLPVIQNLNFDIYKGEIFSLVGESGCGKSICSLSLSRLLPIKQFQYKTGEIYFNGLDILKADDSTIRDLRGKEISYIFQDPFTSLNPLKKIKYQIIESYLLHKSSNEKEALDKAKYLLNHVGLTELDDRLNAYPQQMSGGMLQRICIAMALMCDPLLLVADEPTSALDVTIQYQLVELLLKLQRENQMSILFISHDISLVGYIANRIAVMYAGQIVESGTTDSIIDNPLHPYTSALLASVPSKLSPINQKLKGIDGIVPSPLNYPVGCHFSTRCEMVMDKCRIAKPDAKSISMDKNVSCFLMEKDVC